MNIKDYLKKLDWILIAAALSISFLGLLSIWSSSQDGDFFNFKKQLIFLGIGFFLMILISLFDYRILRDNPYLILIFYFLCLAGLIGLFFLAPEIRGIKGWYKVGPVSIDPIEPTKIVLLILLAKYFSKRHVEMHQARHILLSGAYVILPSALIFLQPDLGSVLILIAVWAAILLISKIKSSHFLILLLCSLLVLTVSWSFLMQPYQKERILSFIAPQLDPLGAGWNRIQSKIAIGSGELLGTGLGRGSQTQYGFLPETQTDFIFASLAEETGLVGIAFLLILFSILLWRILKIAFMSPVNFSCLFAVGFAVLLFSQAFINIAMNLGILPVIGIPLPLVSYGGSGLISIFVGFGLLQNMKIIDIS